MNGIDNMLDSLAALRFISNGETGGLSWIIPRTGATGELTREESVSLIDRVLPYNAALASEIASVLPKALGGGTP